MPYFHNEEINLLFIHIPKSGGTSLESYFSEKYKIPLNDSSLFDIPPNGYLRSLQHLPYQILFSEKEKYQIQFDDLKIITIVRNPYYRIISDLFFFELIDKNSHPDDVYMIICKYIFKKNYDNHNQPQHFFITNEEGKIIDNLIILRTEILTHDMHNIGYKDFNFHELKNVQDHTDNYESYLNNDSIQLINKIYEKDFILFNYEIKQV